MESLQSYKRANFFPGLKATPAFWNEMEDYHFNKETLSKAKIFKIDKGKIKIQRGDLYE